MQSLFFMKRKTIYVGVDLGLRNTGLAFGDDKGHIHKVLVVESKKSDHRLKSAQLWAECYGVTRQLRPHLLKVSAIGVELPHGGAKGNNPASLRLMSAAVGIFAALTCSLPLGPPVITFTPQKVKRRVCPSNRAVSKEEVIRYSKILHPEVEWPKTKGLHEHIADAMVVYDLLIATKVTE